MAEETSQTWPFRLWVLIFVRAYSATSIIMSTLPRFGSVSTRLDIICAESSNPRESPTRTAMDLGVLIIQGRHWLLCCWPHPAPIGTSTISSKYRIKYLTNIIIYECSVSFYHLGPNPVKNMLDIVPLCERARCLIGIGNFSRSNMEEAAVLGPKTCCDWIRWYCWCFRNPANPPVEGKVVYPTIYKVLAPSQVVFSPDFWSIKQ